MKEKGTKVDLGNGKFAYTSDPNNPNAEKIIINEEEDMESFLPQDLG